MPAPELQTARVPGFLHFTADEYRATAQACRIAAAQAEDDASKQTNPSIVKMFNASAKRYRDLAQKYDLAARVL